MDIVKYSSLSRLWVLHENHEYVWVATRGQLVQGQNLTLTVTPKDAAVISFDVNNRQAHHAMRMALKEVSMPSMNGMVAIALPKFGWHEFPRTNHHVHTATDKNRGTAITARGLKCCCYDEEAYVDGTPSRS